MNILFLDDERFPEDIAWIKYPDNFGYIIARNFEEFKHYWENVEFDAVSFDHDLQDFHKGGEYTGMDCVKWLVETLLDTKEPLPHCFFHTQNPIGKGNMETYWSNFIKFKKERSKI